MACLVEGLDCVHTQGLRVRPWQGEAILNGLQELLWVKNDHRIRDTEDTHPADREQVPPAAIFGKFGGSAVMAATVGFDA
ncbi:hypothetical protein [Arthrobacter flavus]|uniref:Uncharacterized protein n=1 Tax=Arthrobacter flavus TaxID=95172 RepID=A0ABW4Q3I2_9MICC